uniref:Uncharacterized protein n=1 Tax=Avena sativa TaxID=4498 RepID=A0ACD5ZNV5_AVESA
MAGVRVASDKALMALVVAVLVMCGGGLAAAASNLVPAVYVFGDSTLDVGMNGPLPLPYGIDLPDESLPTRVSNGFNLADYISRELGFENSPPAYESLKPNTSHQILRGFGGVSYASGGSGILNTTRIMNNSISLAEQIDLFAATKLQMTQYARGKGSVAALDERLAESLFLISAGGNDFFRHIQSLCWRPCLPTFRANLLSNFTNHVQTLYGLGARRFGIVGVPPVGCVPLLRKITLGGGCLDYANNIVREFNTLVAEMMANFSTDPEPHGMMYSVGSAFNVLMNFTNDPVANGFTVVNSACCGDGRFGAGTFCVKNATVCENRADHLYWDFAHSTQATAEKGAAIIFAAPVEEGFAAPINFQQLVSPSHGSGGFSSA